MNETPETFVSLRTAAMELGLPAAWLKSEADAGRVPHLLVGRRMFMNTAVVASTLLQRAASCAMEGADSAD